MPPDYEPNWPKRLSIEIGLVEGLPFLCHVANIHLNFRPLVGEIVIRVLEQLFGYILRVENSIGRGVDLVKLVHAAPLRGETSEQILDGRLKVNVVSVG
ncbi:hypothetical protein TorRG33x02_125600 [Trema orientale]|uniref:Uncharacterized protein n=1 Tax=Trema orientale TaxID=63057 RepID=A0A2P5F1S9_TREOI|nr:hypothetical protein TorRG33x02_125600 [Trema orientale]